MFLLPWNIKFHLPLRKLYCIVVLDRRKFPDFCSDNVLNGFALNRHLNITKRLAISCSFYWLSNIWLYAEISTFAPRLWRKNPCLFLCFWKTLAFSLCAFLYRQLPLLWFKFIKFVKFIKFLLNSLILLVHDQNHYLLGILLHPIKELLDYRVSYGLLMDFLMAQYLFNLYGFY
jgi:hypothetical protein